MVLTCLRVKNRKENVQKLSKAAKNLVRISNEGTCKKAKERTAVTSKSKKLELESSHKQLEILAVKADNRQVIIEFRGSSTSAPSISGTDEIKVEDEVDIKKENEMEFCALRSTVQFIPETDAEEHINQTNQNGFTEIKVEGEIEVGATTITVQSIPTTAVESHSSQTVQGEFTESEDEMEFCDEVEIDALNTPETTTADKPDKNRIYYTCDTCPKKFLRKDNLKAHRLLHGNLDCTVCGMANFTQYDELDTHMKTQDTNPKNFTCDICSKQFSTKIALNQHRLRHGEPRLKCTVCGVTKFTQYELDRHMKIHDTNRIKFTCEICSKQCSTLDTHMKTHDTNRIKFTCDICSKQCSTKIALNRHRSRHAAPTLECTVCGVAKFTQYELDRHMKTHDTNRIKFTCDICSTQCSSMFILKRHRTHHGEPNFKCTVCGVAKFTQYELDLHMKTHDPRPTNQKKFTCDICPKKFLRKGDLRAHRRRHGKPNFHCTACDVAKFTQNEMNKHMKVHNSNPDHSPVNQCLVIN